MGRWALGLVWVDWIIVCSWLNLFQRNGWVAAFQWVPFNGWLWMMMMIVLWWCCDLACRRRFVVLNRRGGHIFIGWPQRVVITFAYRFVRMCHRATAEEPEPDEERRYDGRMNMIREFFVCCGKKVKEVTKRSKRRQSDATQSSLRSFLFP